MISMFFFPECHQSNPIEDPHISMYRTKAISLLNDASGNRKIAHQIQEAADAAFHVGRPRYFECISRIAYMLKVGWQWLSCMLQLSPT